MLTQKDVEILNIEQKYQGFVRVKSYTLKHRLYDGSWSNVMHRELVDRGHAVAVLAIDEKTEQVILTQQFRIGAIQADSPWILDVIAGMIEVGEAPEEVAMRESQEEVGGELKILEKIATYYGSAGACSEQTTLFLGSMNSESLPQYAGCKHENEDILIVKMKYQEFFDYLQSAHCSTASLTIAGLWLKKYLSV